MSDVKNKSLLIVIYFMSEKGRYKKEADNETRMRERKKYIEK